MDDPYVDKELVSNLLYNEEKYIKEFAGASIESFTEFKIKFTKFFLAGDMNMLRQTGHKIKPVAQMLNLDELLVMYERSKELLASSHPLKEKEKLLDKVVDYCDKVIHQFEEMK
ncbi:MAG: taurine dioxygenase [Balneolaceae bacterium]